ncbi:MAG: hypothetical protein ACRBDI_06525 [Alphaproteobacteria bacterium]
MKTEIDINTHNKAAEGDASALFDLAMSYRLALEALPNEISDEEQNHSLQGNRLLLANEFYKVIREAAHAGSPDAMDYVQELTKQNKVPLKRYDGKIFRGMAELAKAGDTDARNVAVCISKGLKNALLRELEALEFPGKLVDKPKETARDLLNAKTDKDFDAIKDTVQKSHDIFQNAAYTNLKDSNLRDNYNKQATALNQIDKGLSVYKNMIKTLAAIKTSQASPS